MTCLQVTTRDGRVLLELDEHGQIVIADESVDVVNLVPDRIAAAAGGGLDLKNLPPELEVVYADDVEIANWGESWARGGPWVMLRLLGTDALARFRSINPPELARRLDDDGSTLRAVIFRADQVHFEDEIARSEAGVDFDVLDGSDFFSRVRAARPGMLPCYILEALGAAHWGQVSPAALYLWAVDRGVADYLPECYRNAIHHEEVDP